MKIQIILVICVIALLSITQAGKEAGNEAGNEAEGKDYLNLIQIPIFYTDTSCDVRRCHSCAMQPDIPGKTRQFKKIFCVNCIRL